MYPGDDTDDMYRTLISHFVLKLNEERQKVDELQRKLDCANQRISLLECANYGLF
jgi:hypothetical protein